MRLRGNHTASPEQGIDPPPGDADTRTMANQLMCRPRKLSLRSLRWVTPLILAIASPNVVFAQGCALCYTQAAGGGSRLIHALRSGILLLVIPPVLICMGIAIMAYKKRNQFNED